jgi:saccharopepsin
MLAKLSLLLIPLVAASGVHKLKLKKITPVSIDPSLEGQFLSQKYAAQSLSQLPLMGAGGAGRRFPPTQQEGQDLYWTQEYPHDGHRVPLTSAYAFSGCNLSRASTLSRFHECAILH